MTHENTERERAAHVTEHVAEHFDLPSRGLRDPTSHRWDARRIAEALGISLGTLAPLIGDAVDLATVESAPDAVGLQEGLVPFGNVLAMAHDYFAGDAGKMLVWLETPRARLGGLSPRDALQVPGKARIVEEWVAGGWLGEGEM